MDKITGACHCKSVRYTINGPIKASANCHCSICKKISGAAFATIAIVGEESFKITEGQENLSAYVVSDNLTKPFCHTCSTPIFNTHKKFSGNRMLHVGAFDVSEIATPAINVHCEHMLPWVKGIAEIKCFNKEFTR